MRNTARRVVSDQVINSNRTILKKTVREDSYKSQSQKIQVHEISSTKPFKVVLRPKKQFLLFFRFQNYVN